MSRKCNQSSYMEKALEAFAAEDWNAGLRFAERTDMKDARIQYWMGYCFESGLGVRKDEVKAFRWYEMAAANGNAVAQNQLAVCYEYGIGTEKNIGEAFNWYKKAAENGDSEGQGNIADMYERGCGVEKNLKLAFHWYHVSAENGNVGAQCKLGNFYEHGTGTDVDLMAALKWYRLAAENGEPYGMVNVGLFYQYGKGVGINCGEAFMWYKKAAERGHPLGQYKLGLCYELGEGVVQDLKRAFSWYMAAAENGNSDGQCKAGLCYEFGKGIGINEDKAFSWFKLSAENGNPRGQLNLGEMYEYGKGTEKDLEEALRWYKAAAEQGDSDAQNNLGVFYDNGIGTEKSCEEALKWFEKAAATGNSSAQCNLGLMHEFGRGTLASKEDAFKWYKLSAENGDSRGQYNLGDMYEHGKGTEQNISEALKWYAKAAEQGDEDAKKKIVELDVQKAEEALSDDEGKDALRDVLNTLTDRERQVVDFRFGISDGCCRTLDEVARLFNLPSRDVRMIEANALRKMKRGLEDGDARAQFYLGMMYEKRNESEKDKVEAVKWYCKAAGQGHDGAKKKLAELEKVNDEGNVEHAETPVIQRMQKGKKVKKPSIKKAYSEMNAAASEVFVAERGIDVVEMNGIDDYLYCMEMPEDIDEEALLAASNELFHRIGVLPEERNLALNEEEEYCAVHRNEYSGACFVLFNHPVVMEHGDCGDTVRMFGETQRKAIAEEEAEDSGDDGFADEDDEAWMRQLAEDIKSGAIRSKSGEGYFVLKGEYYDAIEMGRKTTEYRDLTPRNLSMSIGIKTVKFQRGYGHPGKPPRQMRYEVSSVRLMDASDRECDPYAIPPGFIAATIAIHLGKRIG